MKKWNLTLFILILASQIFAQSNDEMYYEFIASADLEYETNYDFDIHESDPNEFLSRRNFSTGWDSLKEEVWSYNKLYYVRQELQALVDMYCATQDRDYLNLANSIVQDAIEDSLDNQLPFKTYGDFPSFIWSDPNHIQLNDFQGAAGFMLVGEALYLTGNSQDAEDAEDIFAFVEEYIVKKWLEYDANPQITDAQLLARLQVARDKREHFATICLLLDRYPTATPAYNYRHFAEFLCYLYLRQLDEPGTHPYCDVYDFDKSSWSHKEDIGIYWKENSLGVDTLLWQWTLKSYTDPNDPNRYSQVGDTSHSCRTVWLAVEAEQDPNNLLDTIETNSEVSIGSTITGMIDTLVYNIWQSEPNIPYYFTNIIDGNDFSVQSMGPGQKGNLWLGWHRLAEYDSDLRNLFLDIAWDLSQGNTSKFPEGAQNVGMQNAPMCFYAWAARLLYQDCAALNKTNGYLSWSIQDAIDDANDLDEIIVYPGTYYENIDFGGVNVYLRSVDPNDPCVVAATVIDGNDLGSVVTFENGESSSAVLRGFTITGGQANDYSYDGFNGYDGGGIVCNGSSPVIRQCVISGNEADDDGGGIYCVNSAGPMIDSCSIYNNTALDKAGGVYCKNGSSANIVDCFIFENSARDGGGIACKNSSPTVSNCLIYENTTSDDAGGAYFLENSNPTIQSCILINNYASDKGGGVYSKDGASPTILNSLIANNKSDYGAGLYDNNSDSALINCTIVNNDSNETGGGLYLSQSSDCVVTNCIFWENIDENSSATAQIYHTLAGTLTLSYSCIEDWSGSETGVITSDPNLDSSCYLTFGSPCIDAGDPNYIPYANEVDVAQDPRVINGRIDMGADESSQLLTHWKLDESEGTTANDFMGNGDGILIGAPIWQPSSGIFDGCLTFDGVDDYIDCVGPDVLHFTGKPSFTISAWINPGEVNNFDTIIGNSQGGSATAVRFNLDIHYNKLRVTWGDGVTYIASYSAASTFTTSAIGNWYHVVALTDGSVIKIYIDGQQSGSSTPVTIDLAESTANWFIGRGFNSSSYLFKGKIDDVRIYNRALTEFEISSLSER